VGTTRSGVVGLAAAVLTLAAPFFFDFPAAGLVAAVDLGSVLMNFGLLFTNWGRRLARSTSRRLPVC